MTEKTHGTNGSMYQLVRDFLRDFYHAAKRGARVHKKGIAIAFTFLFLCFFIFLFALYKVSETAFFCGICHNMKVYVASWKVSKHKEVGCIKCHYKPGFVNHLKGKWRDGQLSMAYFITGKGPTKPHAEIDDASCLQSGCHRKEDLKKEVVFKNVIFNHLNHIDEMKREKKLRCTTCHSQIVQGAHIKVTVEECFICHFYKTKGQREFFTGCRSCHFEAKGDIRVSPAFIFNHKMYMNRGIRCEECHINVVTGDGHIRENVCLECHNKREILEAKYTPEFLHRNHVTEHKVECFICHSPIKHEIPELHYKSIETQQCSQCHQMEVHSDKISMYLGKGAKFVEETPNRMASINMDCGVCHTKGENKADLHGTCKECHGSLTDGMTDRWERILKDREEEILKEILELKGVLDQKRVDREWKKKLDDALYNYTFLLKGNGIHNIIYSMKIVEATKNMLREIRANSEGKLPKYSQFKLSCTDICHGNIGERKVPFGSVTFPHEIHSEGEGSCQNCHSPYSNHGKTVYKDCSSCHHGEGSGKVSCKDCHRADEKMFNGTGVAGLEVMKSPMHGKVPCADCHRSIKEGKKESVASIKNTCIRCHKKGYEAKVDEWMKTAKDTLKAYEVEVSALEKDIAAIEAREDRHLVPFRKISYEAREALNFLTEGMTAHNPVYSKAIGEKIAKNIAALKKMIQEKKEGKPVLYFSGS